MIFSKKNFFQKKEIKKRTPLGMGRITEIYNATKLLDVLCVLVYEYAMLDDVERISLFFSGQTGHYLIADGDISVYWRTEHEHKHYFLRNRGNQSREIKFEDICTRIKYPYCNMLPSMNEWFKARFFDPKKNYNEFMDVIAIIIKKSKLNDV